jgi:hypothetical protein
MICEPKPTTVYIVEHPDGLNSLLFAHRYYRSSLAHRGIIIFPPRCRSADMRNLLHRKARVGSALKTGCCVYESRGWLRLFRSLGDRCAGCKKAS